jgi:hypothetical protein
MSTWEICILLLLSTQRYLNGRLMQSGARLTRVRGEAEGSPIAIRAVEVKINFDSVLACQGHNPTSQARISAAGRDVVNQLLGPAFTLSPENTRSPQGLNCGSLPCLSILPDYQEKSSGLCLPLSWF